MSSPIWRLVWVDASTATIPWCVLIYHKAPHRPWEPDEKHAGDVRRSDPDARRRSADDYATRTASARRAAMRIAEQLNAADLKQTRRKA